MKVKVGIIGGTGLDDPANQILKGRREIKREYARNEFGLPSSNLYQGVISGVEVVLLSRHGHGHKISPTGVNYRANIEALRKAGCTHILASTACGSLTDSIPKGQLVIPNSFIDRTVHRKGTLFDNTSEHYSGVCHLPMEPSFDTDTAQILEQAAKNLRIPIIRGGTVVSIEGPRYSSKAESKMFRQWGGHLINMTTCPEVVLAKEAGLLYASIAMATDYDSWKDDQPSVSSPDAVELFNQNVKKITDILVEAVGLIGEGEWDERIDELKNLIKTNIVSH